MENHAKVCRLLLDEFKSWKIHVVGHSMGGAVGLLLAEGVSDRLGSFMNLEGNLVGEDCGLLSRKAAGATFEEFKSSIFDELRHTIGSSDDRGSKLWVGWSKKSDALGFYKSAKSLVEWSDSGGLLQKFQELKINKAYFFGEKGFQSPVLQKLQEINKISIPNSGHFVMNDNPEEFYPRLAGAIKMRR
jgi:pimeloyl-ACP methyl ester carboxylesterase